MGCSIINHPAFLGYPHFWKPPDVAYQKISKLAVWFLHSWKLLHLPILVGPLSFRSRTFSSSRPPGCTSSWTRTMCHGESSTWKSVRSQRFVFPKIHHFFSSHWIWTSGFLVGGLEHEFYFPIQLGMSSSQLTHIFEMGRYTTNQIIYLSIIFPLFIHFLSIIII